MILLSKIIKYLLIGLLKSVFIGIIILPFHLFASPVAAQAPAPNGKILLLDGYEYDGYEYSDYYLRKNPE